MSSAHASTLSQYGDDELYFGTERVHLRSTSGSSVNYCHDLIQPDSSLQSIARTIQRAQPAQSNDGQLPWIVPCMPSVDPEPTCVPEEYQKISSDISSWPEFLQSPLIKVPEHDAIPNELEAFASGTRSCCFKGIDGKTWFRLKGSGNHDQGFLIRKSESQGWRDIRGCAFAHTAICENYYTTRLARAMEPFDVQSCNSAIGHFVYDQEPLGAGTEKPCCVVMKTLGDRRLGTHVLTGVSLLLDRLVDTNSLSMQALRSSFPPIRPLDDSSPGGLSTTAMLMSDYQLVQSMIYFGAMEADPSNPNWDTGLSWQIPRDEHLFVNLVNMELPGANLPEIVPESDHLPRQCTTDGLVDCDPRWLECWKRACDELRAALNSLEVRRQTGEKLPSALSYLYARIGFECGRFAHLLHHKCRVSWGTYADAMCHDSQLHCNAHSNNMVLIPEAAGFRNYLAFLDLDMAFDEHSFVDINTGKLGTSAVAHDSLLHLEHVNFAEVLSGADASSGVPAVAAPFLQQMPESVKLLQTALQDTLITAYLKAYGHGRKGPLTEADDVALLSPLFPFDQDLHSAGHAIMRMACIVQARFLA